MNRVRRTLGLKRVGHAGTLDPMATGVLVMAVGPATRLLQYLPLEPKVYEAEIRFGQATDTQDAEGIVISEGEVPTNLSEQLDSNRIHFIGMIEQTPPMFSAIKMNGKPLYSLARQGEEVERIPRQITINSLDILGLEGNVAKVRVSCSAGTYIRTLAHDLGKRIGCGAHLSALRRIQVGAFAISDAVQLDQVSGEHVVSPRDALGNVHFVELESEDVARVRNGQAISTSTTLPGKYAGLLDGNGCVFSIARVLKDKLQPECVLPFES